MRPVAWQFEVDETIEARDEVLRVVAAAHKRMKVIRAACEHQWKSEGATIFGGSHCTKCGEERLT